MKRKRLFLALLSIMVLSGCKKFKDKSGGSEVNPDPPTDFRISEKINNDRMPISLPDLNTEEGIREYLVGNWYFDVKNVNDIVCEMNVDEDLNVELFFHNYYTGGEKGEYQGKIKLSRKFANPDQAPDLISIELMDYDFGGGNFYFLHRSIAEGKRIMSWFFADAEHSIFHKLAYTNRFEYEPREIIFEKIEEEKSLLLPRKSDKFYAVYWGKEFWGKETEKGFWLDDIQWIEPIVEDDFKAPHPRRMAIYENQVLESIVYRVAEDKKNQLSKEQFYPGKIYFVKTDEDGNIIEFTEAEHRAYCDYEMKIWIFDIIENHVKEIKESINIGKSILFNRETIILDDEECYLVELGTNHEEEFVQGVRYAVNFFTYQVYRYDILSGTWEPVEMEVGK